MSIHTIAAVLTSARHRRIVQTPVLEGPEGDDAGIAYEVVKQPLLRFRRGAIKQHTGQRRLPVIELEDGTFIREESDVLAARIRPGEIGRGFSRP